MFLPPPFISKIAKRNLTNDDKLLKLRLEQSSKVIAEVLKDKSIASELGGQIARKLKITGNNESLTFRELFQETDGRKTQSTQSINPKFFTMDVDVAKHFKVKYLEVLKSKNYEHPEKYAELEKSSNISTNEYNDGPTCYECITDLPPGAEIYFPYSENFLSNNYGVDPNLAYTVTSHPIDNSDENEGIAWNEFTQSYDYVIVDDNYAYDRPTLIVTIDDGPTENERLSNTLDGYPAEYRPSIITNATTPPPPPFFNPSPTLGSRVYFGKLHLRKFAEGLFDGGSEIVLIRPSITPSLDANGNLTTANVAIQQLIPLDVIRRKQIRKMRNNVDETVWVGGTFTNEWRSRM